jgi:hypothetical protein
MRETHLDQIVSELLLARLLRPDFIATLNKGDARNAMERQALIDEIDSLHQYMEEVRTQAAAMQRFDLIVDQEARITPKLEFAQARLNELDGADPYVMKLLREGTFEKTWPEMDIIEKRRTIRSFMAPRVNRIDPSLKGKKGLNYDRVEPGWH